MTTTIFRTQKTPFLLVAVIIAFSGMFTPSVQAQSKIGTAVGEYYPDFLLPTLEGKSGRLSQYRGKKIVLFHFASW